MGFCIGGKTMQYKTLLDKLTRNAISRLDKISVLMFNSLKLRTVLWL